MDARVAASPPRLRRIADLPGPRGLPFVGSLLQTRPARMHRDIEAWCRAYGALFRVRLGPRRLLVVADPEVIAAVLRERPQAFRRSTRLAEVGLEDVADLIADLEQAMAAFGVRSPRVWTKPFR